MDENWRNDLDNIKTAQNVLSDKDLKELRTYMYNNMAFDETETHRRIARKDKKDFPIYFGQLIFQKLREYKFGI